MGVTGRLFLCLATLGLLLYQIVDNKNRVMELQREIPPLEKELGQLEKENDRLRLLFDAYASPATLMQLMEDPSLGRFRFPREDEVAVVDLLEPGEL